MTTTDLLNDLKQRSHGEPFVIGNADEAERFNIPVAEYVRAIRDLCRNGALEILIEPMGSFFIRVNMLAE